jgi:hypothetical protein
MSEEEFQEIAHTGGKITFLYDHEDQGISIEYKQGNPWTVSIFQVCVSFDGVVLDFVPFGGLEQAIPYPQPSILAYVMSDREGLFGRKCRKCASYFRSQVTQKTTCPYCGYKDRNIKFLTDNQLEFIGHFCNSFIDAHTKGETVEIDLDELTNRLTENKSGWMYAEERQQSQHLCPECKCKYDILGDYGICPSCGVPNFKKVIESKIDALEARLKNADENITDRHEREIEWEKLIRCVSEFETLANTVRDHLMKLPLIPKRRNDLSRVNFQGIINAAEQIEKWFGITILQSVNDEDRKFLNKMFNRRHIFTHNSGKIDQKYIDDTGDTTVRVNQVIRLSSKEIKRLIPLVRLCSQNIVNGFNDIK